MFAFSIVSFLTGLALAAGSGWSWLQCWWVREWPSGADMLILLATWIAGWSVLATTVAWWLS